MKLTVKNVQESLDSTGKSFSDFRLADLLASQECDIQCTRDVVDALNAVIPIEYINAQKELNEGQRYAYK